MEPGFDHAALFSYFNAKMSPTAILSELFDNALDAGADKIYAEINRAGLSVCDNGSGIDSLQSMIRIGASGKHSDFTAIGQYGCGGKHSLLAVGSKFQLVTRHGDRYIETEVDWMRFAKRGFHSIADPLPVSLERLSRENRAAMSDGWTTRVAVTGVHKHRSRSFSGVSSYSKTLAIRYRPALMAGVTIVINHNGTEYALNDHPYTDPVLSDVVTTDTTVCGKAVSIRAGLTEKHIPGLTGRFLISYGPRIIEDPRDAAGQNLPSQLYVEVGLSPDWRSSLSTLKDEVTNDRDDLLKACLELTAPLRELIEDVQRERRFEIVCDNIGRSLTDAWRQLKRKGESRIRKTEDGAFPVIAAEADTGPGSGPTPNPGRPMIESGVMEDGNNDVEQLEAANSEPDSVAFRVIANEALGQHCLVRSTSQISQHSGELVIELNTAKPIIKKAFEGDGEALLLMVSHAIAEHLACDRKIQLARALFGRIEFDDDAEYETKAWVIAGLIIENLPALRVIDKSELHV